MATVAGPALSFDASGKFGGTLVFSKWKGRPVVRQLVIPANPKTAAQTAVRAAMRWGSREWAQLSAVEQATWEAPAKPTNILPFNAFIKQGQDNIAQDMGYQSEYPAPTAAAPGIVTAPAATGGAGQADLSWVDSLGANDFGHIVYAALNAVVTPSPQNIRGIADMTDLGIIIRELEPGTWHFKVKTFNTAGVLGTATADFTATVT